MAKVDYRGARGSNAGDDFHELWALRQALSLFDPETHLRQVTVEGLRAEDESGKSSDTWDGVDCTLYYGDDQDFAYKRIVIAQLKYSAANSSRSWTVARLCHSENKRKDNSVISRLAKAFANLRSGYPDLVESGNLVVQLISNQNISSAVIRAFSGAKGIKQPKQTSQMLDYTKLRRASGLSAAEFKLFASALDFSQCGHKSRFAVEERVFTTISAWTDNDARSAVNDLLRFVRRKMMPEAKGEVITRHSIVASMGFSDLAALFPCPPSHQANRSSGPASGI